MCKTLSAVRSFWTNILRPQKGLSEDVKPSLHPGEGLCRGAGNILGPLKTPQSGQGQTEENGAIASFSCLNLYPALSREGGGPEDAVDV